jgi:RNA polymerase-associated protein RTF1
MADDLDDELFSLAAGSAKPAKKRRRRAAAESEDEDAVSEEDVPKRKRGPAKAAPKRPARAASEDEAGEDDGMDGGAGNEDDLYEGDDDRRKLEAMTELEREMILAERAEQRDKERQRKQLLKQQRSATEKASSPGSCKTAALLEWGSVVRRAKRCAAQYSCPMQLFRS